MSSIPRITSLLQDEFALSQLLANNYPNIQLQKVTSENVGFLDTLEQTVRSHSGPNNRDFSTMGSQILIDMQKQNQKSLLSGFGGEQVVTGFWVG